MSNQHKTFPYLSMASLTAFLGLVAFIGVASNPRFATMHTLDIIRLMTAGASIAVTVAALIQHFTGKLREEAKRTGEH